MYGFNGGMREVNIRRPYASSSIRGAASIHHFDGCVGVSKLLARRWPTFSTQQWLEKLGFVDAQRMLPLSRKSRVIADVRTVPAVVSVILRLNFCGLTRLLTLQAPRLKGAHVGTEVDQLAIADSALSWLRRLFGERRCLWKALAVSGALNAHGHACMLVFGYNSTPYGGRKSNNVMHVWVETEQSNLALVWGNMHEYLEVDRAFLRRARPGWKYSMGRPSRSIG
jgi:hypothetical protein